MLPLHEYLRPLSLTLAGLAVFAVDVVIFHVFLDRRVSGIGLIGFGVAVAGGVWIVDTWRERRDAVRYLEEREW